MFILRWAYLYRCDRFAFLKHLIKNPSVNTIRRSKNPARKRSHSEDFMEAAFLSGNFRIFPVTFIRFPDGKRRRKSKVMGKNPKIFRVGILLPFSSDFSLFSSGYGGFLAICCWFLQYPVSGIIDLGSCWWNRSEKNRSCLPKE